MVLGVFEIALIVGAIVLLFAVIFMAVTSFKAKR